jgi:hypothetical protein
MKLQISGVGLWGPDLCSWQDFLTAQTSDFRNLSGPTATPSPQTIPAREMRRAPLPVKIAIEVIEQACAMASIETGRVATVFSSAMGDNAITDYICRALSAPEKFLSPTKFHNSVHNAASGYWSIAAGNRSPSGYVGAFEDSFSIAALEAATLCVAEARPVVLAIYDVPTMGPLTDICTIQHSFGAAFVLEAGTRSDTWPIEISCREGAVERQRLRSHQLQKLCDENPAAQALALLEAIASSEPALLRWPTGNATHLEMRLANE